MKRIILIGDLALCCIALCCVVLTGCGAKVTGFEIAMPESLPVGEASIAEINATYDKPEATDEQKAKAYFEKIENVAIPPFKVNSKIDGLIRQLILAGGVEVDSYLSNQQD